MAKGKRPMMPKAVTNIQKISRSEKPPEQDDIFAIKLPNGKFLLGQVILANPTRDEAPTPVANLIYIFADQHDVMPADNVRLDVSNLLIPPVWTNSLGWKKGYFQKIGDGSPNTRLDQHCFRRYNGTYLDERRRLLPHRVEPCGEWGLVSYRWIDDHISDALGIPRAPEDG